MTVAQSVFYGCSTFTWVPSFLGGILVLGLIEFALLLYFFTGIMKWKPRNRQVSAVEIETQGGTVSFSLQVLHSSIFFFQLAVREIFSGNVRAIQRWN